MNPPETSEEITNKKILGNPEAATATTREGQMELSESVRDLLRYINNTPVLLSLLYDIDMMPEQLTRGTNPWLNMLMIASYFRDHMNSALLQSPLALIQQFAATFRYRLGLETQLADDVKEALVRYATEALADETADELAGLRAERTSSDPNGNENL